MSDPTGPVRRRRIAGESKPAAPSAKPAVPKVPARKAAAKKAAMQKSAPPQTPPVKPVPTAKAVRPAKVVAPAVDDGAADSGPGLPMSRLVPAVLVAVIALVAGVLLTVGGIQDVRGGGGDDLDSQREQAVSAASTAAQTIFSFSSDKLPEHESASKAHMTPSFAKDFEKVAPALTQVTADRKVQVEAVAREAAPLPCGDECFSDEVDVLIFLDQARLVGSSTKPTVFANRVSVSMSRTDDGWLVNNIRAL